MICSSRIEWRGVLYSNCKYFACGAETKTMGVGEFLGTFTASEMQNAYVAVHISVGT
jgi:hypothetical protein